MHDVATSFTLMTNNITIARLLNRDRSHQPPACFRPVTRIDVHMAGIEAFGAVIGIAIPDHGHAAMGADKIFDPTLKFT